MHYEARAPTVDSNHKGEFHRNSAATHTHINYASQAFAIDQ